MPPLKAIEQAQFGGVDSRSNPIVMPAQRFLRLRNWRPRPDGHLELRDGYVVAVAGLPTVGGPPLHSIYGFTARGIQGGPPAGTRCIMFWQGNAPHILRFDTGAVYTPSIRGNPIISRTRWQYALGKNGDVYMHNGTDRKFFDGVVFRDIGLPVLPAAEVAGVIVTAGSSSAGTGAPTAAQATAVQMSYVNSQSQTPPFTADWTTDNSELFLAFFDTSNNTLLPCTTPLSGTIIPQSGLGGGGGLTVNSGSIECYSGMVSPPNKTTAALFGDNAIAVWGDGLAGTIANFTQFQIDGDKNTYFTAGGAHSAGVGVPAGWCGWAVAVQGPSGPVLGSLKRNETLGAAVTFPASGIHPNEVLHLTNLPVSGTGSVVGLISVKGASAAGASFLAIGNLPNPATLSIVNSTTVNVNSTAHGLSTGNIVTLHANGVPWSSNGPFVVTVVDANNFTFTVPNSASYTGAISGVSNLVVLPHGATAYTFTCPTWPPPLATGQGVDTGVNGVLLPYADQASSGLLPSSGIGGAQPGYQFWVAILNVVTGHVGNRTPIGARLVPSADSQISITGLPNLNGLILPDGKSLYWPPGLMSDGTYKGDDEWRLLIGRTGDGGEVPYAVTDANGNWITTTAASESSINIASATVDGNSELPTTNSIPPPFNCFWREGDKMCGSIGSNVDGTIPAQPFVFRSGSELDDTTGIFVGDPAESWFPAQVETFPTAEPILGGFGFMQESWVFTQSDCGQLSELSGEPAWNGPYNFGIAGPYAFDKGWQSLPFWVSQDKQLCTMLPGSNGPIPISTEYEAALLARIDDAHKAETEVVFFRDPARLVEVLRIKCVAIDPVSGLAYPYTVIHDFNMRDDSSPYGQGYEDIYLGPLGTALPAIAANDYTHSNIRDGAGHQRMWAGGTDGNLYQLYTGGDDAGNYFTADGIMLRYMGGEHTAVKTLEWYGDMSLQWFIYENMLNVYPDAGFWVNLTFEARPVPGDAQNAHYMADLQRPEMTHCYLWAQLQAHPFDAPNPSDPMAFSDPPHIPLETYGRLYMATPVLGDSRGR